MNKDSGGIWKQVWTSTGINRDQPTCMAMDNKFIYVAGLTYSSANNYDFIVIQIEKETGDIEWTATYNNSYSNYDLATGIGVLNDGVYVTGVSFQTPSLANFHTIKYNKQGSVRWQHDFDYNNLMDIPFALSVSLDDTTIIVTGGSQNNASDWDYQTLIYDTTGTLLSQPRTSGSGAGFDRAQAVTIDTSGNIYITGATLNTSLDLKTVKLTRNGSFVWQEIFDSGGDDIGYDLKELNDGEVIVCGETKGSDQDFFVCKYNRLHVLEWSRQIDGNNSYDVAYKMCLDNSGNVYVTGKAQNSQNGTYDFLTVAYNKAGDELWRDYFDGPEHGDDEARNIAADGNGNIYVTGQTYNGYDYQTVTIKYRTDFFTSPPAVDSPAVAYLFYPNEGQLLDSQDSLITDSTHYYMLHHYPQLFFGYGLMNMVFSHVDQDTSTTDTLQRVDVSFLNSTNPTEAFPVNVNDSISYLNYYLAQCPTGITVHGSQRLLYTDVYDEIDAEYSSNDAGLKLTFIVNPGSTDLNEIGLKFAGQTTLSILNNWQLRVTSLFGTYDFEKPKVYQLDTNNNRISLPWYFSWVIQNGNEAKFTSNGTYDDTKPLIVEISKAVSTPPVPTANMEYSTYYGSSLWDEILASDVHLQDEIFGGYSTSITLPYLQGVNASTVSILPFDGFLFRMRKTSGTIVWGTFYGGSDNDRIKDLEMYDGYVYVCGSTYSDNLPQNIVPAYSTITNGNTINQNNNILACDNFIAKYNYSFGSLMWANYIGSTGIEDENCTISYDRNHFKVYLAGSTSGTDFLTKRYTGSANPYFQSTFNGGSHDGYVMRFTGNGILEWSSYFGSGVQDFVRDIQCTTDATNINTRIYIAGTTRAVDYDQTNVCNSPPTSGDFPNCNLTSGNQYTPGGNGFNDAFITEFNDDLEMEWSTMFGGLGDEYVYSHSLTGYDNSVYLGISNVASNTNFPPLATCTNCFNQTFSVGDGFIAKFDGRALSWSTFYGKGDSDYLSSIKTSEHELFICGGTDMHITSAPSDYCETPNAGELPLCNSQSGYYFDPDYYYLPGTPSGSGDAFLASFNESNELTWATLIKGNYLDRAWDLTVDNDFLFLAGRTSSANIISTSTLEDYPQEYFAGAYNQNVNGGNVDGFVSRFTLDRTIDIPKIPYSEIIASVFPNPVASKLFLKTKSGINDFHYSIINLLGKAIHNKTHVLSNNTEIDCSTLASGAYFLIVQTDKAISSIKIIKN